MKAPYEIDFNGNILSTLNIDTQLMVRTVWAIGNDTIAAARAVGLDEYADALVKLYQERIDAIIECD